MKVFCIVGSGYLLPAMEKHRRLRLRPINYAKGVTYLDAHSFDVVISKIITCAVEDGGGRLLRFVLIPYNQQY